MRLQIAGEMKVKLEHVPQRLRDEFPAASKEAVESEVAEAAGVLLARARFPDYVPLLAYRYAREHLIDDGYEVRRAA